MEQIVLIGGGGHAAVVAEIVKSVGRLVAGYVDDRGDRNSGLLFLGKIDDIFQHPDSFKNCSFVCCVGDNKTRQHIVHHLETRSDPIHWANALIHSSAVVSPSARLECGVVVCAGAVIQTGVQVARHSIVNTSSSVDHDCEIGAFAHIAPGVHLCGHVQVGDGVLIGVGSSVIPYVAIGQNATIGAGSVVLRSVPPDCTLYGVIAHGMVQWLPRKVPRSELPMTLLDDSILSNQFSNYGPAVRRLETRLREWFHISEDKAVILTSSGASALHAMVSGLELFYGKKLKFATQSFTFPCAAQGPLQDSLILDIDESGGLDLDLVDPNAVDGIIVTNCFGHLTNLEKYQQWAAHHNKVLLFDNAATSYGPWFATRKNCLEFGTGCMISLHHTKPMIWRRRRGHY